MSEVSDDEVKLCRDITNGIWRNCIIDAANTIKWDGRSDYSTEDGYDLVNELRMEMLFTNDPNAILAKQIMNEADSMYLPEIKKLSSEHLTLILRVHEADRINRAEKTIDCITTELARRHILGDIDG